MRRLLLDSLAMPSDRAAPVDETAIRACAASGDFDGATTRAIRGYGAEIYGFLVSLARDEARASDAFSFFAENLWRSLRTFEWKCSLRAWCYRLARNALSDVRRRARGDDVALTAVSEIAEAVRSETAAYLKTDAKTELQRLRATLPPDDEQLLVLRVDRDMSFEDLARVFGGDPPLEGAALDREAARLRKRYQLVKERFVAMVRAKRKD